jgi:hypothetical protein
MAVLLGKRNDRASIPAISPLHWNLLSLCDKQKNRSEMGADAHLLSFDDQKESDDGWTKSLPICKVDSLSWKGAGGAERRAGDLSGVQHL